MWQTPIPAAAAPSLALALALAGHAGLQLATASPANAATTQFRVEPFRQAGKHVTALVSDLVLAENVIHAGQGYSGPLGILTVQVWPSSRMADDNCGMMAISNADFRAGRSTLEADELMRLESLLAKVSAFRAAVNLRIWWRRSGRRTAPTRFVIKA